MSAEGSRPKQTGERLQKVLAQAGVASRRKCEELIVAGRVKVNGKVVPLDYSLKNGQVVEILTGGAEQPNRYWLAFVLTSNAKTKIKEEIELEHLLHFSEIFEPAEEDASDEKEWTVVELALRKALKEGTVADECGALAKECDRSTLQVLLRWGRLEVENKSWKQAEAIAARHLLPKY